jgi:hypothetical protein
MTRQNAAFRALAAAVLLLGLLAQAWAAEPIAGKWLLKSQQVSGRETASEPLTLRITQTGDLVEFEFSVTGNQKQQVTLRFAARLDGSAADVHNSEGRKIGTAKVMRGGPSQYLVTLEGPNRPTSSGKMTVSNGGKTLVSESDATAPGGVKLHTVQTFDRQ